jgi:sulfur carrier protein
VTLTLNGEPIEAPDGASLADLIAARVSSTLGVAAAVDGTVVPRGDWPAVALRGGQQIELLTAVQGG